MANNKYEKVKLGLTAYITFAVILVFITIMIFLLVPSKHERLQNLFTGSYEVQKEGSDKEEDKETKTYAIGKDHLLTSCSFRKLKKKIKSDNYTYVMFGDTSSTDFKLNVIDVNNVAKDMIEKAKENDQKLKIKIVIINSKDFTDEDNLEYLRLYLRDVNEDIKKVEQFPTMDLWVFHDDKMINCSSKSEYKDLSIKMVARNHIFSINNLTETK